jgi:hypothetical protein
VQAPTVRNGAQPQNCEALGLTVPDLMLDAPTDIE